MEFELGLDAGVGRELKLGELKKSDDLDSEGNFDPYPDDISEFHAGVGVDSDFEEPGNTEPGPGPGKLNPEGPLKDLPSPLPLPPPLPILFPRPLRTETDPPGNPFPILNTLLSGLGGVGKLA